MKNRPRLHLPIPCSARRARAVGAVTTLGPLALLLALPACADVLGLGDYDSAGTTTSTSSSGGSGGTSTSSSGGSGGTTTSSGGSGGATTTSSSGGSGGTTTSSGGSGGTSTGTTTSSCTPDTIEACAYSGPELTQDVGLCKAATRTCGADGVWGACSGEVLPKIELCTTGVDESCDNLAECTGQFRWAKRFGSPGQQFPYAVAGCPDGGVVVVGEATGALDLDGHLTDDNGGKDFFIVKLDAAGKYLWSHRFGDAADQRGVGVDVAPNGKIVVVGNGAGTFSVGGATPLTVTPGKSNGFVAAYSPAGDHLWSTLVGDAAGGVAGSIAADAAGDVVVSGHDTLSPTKLWLVKLAAFDGAPVWGAPKAFAATDATTRISRVVVHRGGPSPSGDIVIAVIGKAGIDLGGGPLSVAAPGGNDVFLARFDTSGNHLWSHPYGGAGDESGSYDMAMSSGGAVIVIGSSDGAFNFYPLSKAPLGSNDVVLWRVGPAGATNWAMRLAGTYPQGGNGVGVDAADNVLVAGAFQSKIAFGATELTAPSATGRFVAKIALADGATIWSRAFAGGDGSEAKLAADPLGNLFYASHLLGDTNLGGGPLASPGSGDADILIGSFAP